MRIGRRSPQRAAALAGYGLMVLGGLVLVLSVPVYVWAAALGAFLAYLGYTVQRGR